MSEETSPVLKKVLDQFRGTDVIQEHHSFRGDDTIMVRKDRITEVCLFLKEDPDLLFNFMMDLTGVDLMPAKPRFEVVYHLYSLKHNHRIRVKAPVEEENCIIDSITSLWAGANWYEREVWDLYGIRFRGHPDLKRILLYEEFEGHPLRKDYPIDKRQPLIGPMN